MQAESANLEDGGGLIVGPSDKESTADETEVKRHSGGKRTIAELKAVLPNVDAYLYKDHPKNMEPIVPTVGMALGRSTPGVAYTPWLELLALQGYSLESGQRQEGRKGIRTKKGKCNQNVYE